MISDKQWADAFDKLWLKSAERSLQLALLGNESGTIDVADRPGWKYIRKGPNGEDGFGIAYDAVGVANTAGQLIKVRMEHGRLVIREAQAYAGGGNSGGGNGTSYTAGDAIDITGTVISVKREATGAIGLGANNGLRINVGNGLTLDSNNVVVALASNPGLEFDAATLRVKVSDGLARGSNGIAIDLATNPGLEFDGGKIRVKAYHGINRDGNGISVKLKTTSGMDLDSNGLSVGAGDGIDVLTNTVAVDVTDIHNPAYGLYEPTPNDLGIKLAGNSGLILLGLDGLAMGMPQTLSYDSSNHVTSTTHGHAITSSSNVGNPIATSLLRADSGNLTLANLSLYGNLSFAGGNRSILASNNLTIAPSTDLILDPDGLIVIPVGQEIRTGTFNDFVAGISGFRNWDRGGNYRQLTIGAIKADELFVRFFTADESRVNRGEEFWTRSYGIVETDFTVPADEVTVDVWFEEVPGLGNFKLFLPDNWVLIRQIDVDTGLTVQKIWFQVVSAGANDYVQRQNADSSTGRLARQQWRLRRKSGGETGTVIKKGNVAIDFGKPYAVTNPLPGQGVVHLSALAQDGGPFIQIQTFESIIAGDQPQFKNRVRMGNLNGTVDYTTDVFGFAAGNDMSLTPSTGFSGQTIEHLNGMRMFNTDLFFYNGSTLVSKYTRQEGISFLRDSNSWDPDYVNQGITWYEDLGTLSLPPEDVVGHIGLWAGDELQLYGVGGVLISTGSSDKIRLWGSGRVDVTGGPINLVASATKVSGILGVGYDTSSGNPSGARLVVHDNTGFGASAGIMISQGGAGDAQLQWVVSNSGISWTAGIDNSANDVWRLSWGPVIGETFPAITATMDLDVFVGRILTVGATTNPYGTNGGLTVLSPASKSTAGWSRIATLGSSDTSNQLSLSIMQFGSGTANLRRIGLSAAEYQVDYRPLVLQPLGGPVHIGPIGDTYTPQGVTITASLGTETVGTTTAVRLGVLSNTPRIAFQASNSVWEIDNNGGILRIFTPGTVHAQFTSQGRMGIGKSPDSPLHVYQSNSGVRADTGITVEQGGSGDALVQYRVTGVQRWVTGIDQSDGSKFKFAPQLDLSSGAAVTITPSHRMGVNTTDPTAHLDVWADSANALRSVVYSATGYNHVVLGRTRGSKTSPTAVSSGDVVGNILAYGYTSGGWATNPSGELRFQATESYNTGVSGRGGAEFSVWTRDNGAASASKRLLVSHNGQIFLGPNQGFGGAQVVVGSAENVALVVDGNATNSSAPNILGRYSRGSHASPSNVLANDMLLGLYGQGYGGGWPASPTAAIRMVAEQNHTSGAKGTGIYMDITPNGQTERLSAFRLANDGGLFLPYVYDDTVNDNGPRALWINSTGRIGYTGSSKRYKEELCPLDPDEMLDSIMQMRPLSFVYKTDQSKTRHLGLIAEEVETLQLPGVVYHNEAGETESVEYVRLVPVLIAAIQSLAKRMADLEGKLN